MAISVITPGFLTTIQDLGRFHHAHLGISPSGAADPVSLRLGNLLVSNPPDTAALEMTLVGGAFRFESPVRIALAGSDFGASIDNHALPPWQAFLVKAGQLLQCGQTKSGARCYLCVEGGISVPRVLSSSSTQLITGMGGADGRALRAGDHLSLGGRTGDPHRPLWRVKKQVLDSLFSDRPVGITRGPQRDFFDDDALTDLCASLYVVKEASNRMGLRLSGPKLERSTHEDMITEGASLGAIQVPPDGEPIILFVEHPTTGGYPKIANVVTADIHRVGQLRPRDEVRFELIPLSEAIHRLAEQEALLVNQRCLEPTS